MTTGIHAIYHALKWYDIFIRLGNQKKPAAKKIHKFLKSMGYSPYTKRAQELIYNFEVETGKHDSL
jgi:hypothetical protein